MSLSGAVVGRTLPLAAVVGGLAGKPPGGGGGGGGGPVHTVSTRANALA